MTRWWRWVGLCGLAMALAACGGGGSSALTQPDDGYAYPPVVLPSGPSYDANPALALTG